MPETKPEQKARTKKKEIKVSQTDKLALNSVSKFRVSAKKKRGYEKLWDIVRRHRRSTMHFVHGRMYGSRAKSDIPEKTRAHV